jgi:hypothetical protein
MEGAIESSGQSLVQNEPNDQKRQLVDPQGFLDRHPAIPVKK